MNHPPCPSGRITLVEPSMVGGPRIAPVDVSAITTPSVARPTVWKRPPKYRRFPSVVIACTGPSGTGSPGRLVAAPATAGTIHRSEARQSRNAAGIKRLHSCPMTDHYTLARAYQRRGGRDGNFLWGLEFPWPRTCGGATPRPPTTHP